MTASVNFDPAARTYEATRGFPPGVDREVATAAARLIGPTGTRRPVLEIGVGTGRIARPLAALGVPVLGIDLSAGMLGELRRLTPPDVNAPEVLRGDATQLPLRTASCAAVIGVHVFHLIPAWEVALAEITRILVPGGVVLVGHDWRDDSTPSVRLMAAWRAILRDKGHRWDHPGARDFGSVKQHLIDRGAAFTEERVGEWIVRRTVADLLKGFEQRTWSSTWGVPDAEFAGCLAELKVWALDALGAPDVVVDMPHRFEWQRFALR